MLKKLELPDMKKEMRELWKEIEKNIARYGEMSEQEIQKGIERHGPTKRRKE